LNLSSIIKEINNHIEGRESYSSYILKDMKILKENEDDIQLFPIIDIDIDYEDREVILISSELNEEPSKQFEPMPLVQLFSKLNGINTKYKKYEMCSGSSIFQLNEEHCARKLADLAAYGFDDEDKNFFLIQYIAEE